MTPLRIAPLLALAAGCAALPARADTDCILRELATARGISDREPVDRTTRFLAERDRVHAFLRVDCSRVDADRPAFQIRWIFNGRIMRTRDIAVGVSPNWRAWDVMPAVPGQGLVQLFDAEGTLLAEEAFTTSLQ